MGFWENLAKGILSSVINNKESRIGSLGEVAFEVSTEKIMTVNNMSKSYSAKYAEHEIIGDKPILEFTGANLRTISFEIQIHAEWGYNPKEEVKKLVEYCEGGEVLTFILGDGPVGDNKWIIESIEETDEMFTGTGEVLYCKANINLKEYVEDKVEKVNGNS